MILSFDGVDPDIGEDVFVADDAKVIGRVTIGDRSSIWYGCVVRGDVGTIVIGDETNIQDLTTIHITGERFNTRIGSRVTVGHRAILHGCTIEDDALIGMGAIVLDGAVVEKGALVGAGALVAPGKVIPAGTMALGSPARVIKELGPEALPAHRESAQHYVENAQAHAKLFD
jgi:carbonic anhydrase/acetyltransferase-like protein (isoleucine patch superfamily)